MTIAQQLTSKRFKIAKEIEEAVRKHKFQVSYTVSWRNYEDAAIAAALKILPTHVKGLQAEHFDSGKLRREKNRLADLEINCKGERISIAVKSARHNEEPENDLGTFRQYPRKKAIFTAFFDLWVRYDDTEEVQRLDRIFFDRSYRCVGKMKMCDGVRYRKKDGNMRPKSWSMFDNDSTYWEDETAFETGMEKAMLFRANSLVEEHLEKMTLKDQRALYEKLKAKFERKR